MRFRSIGLAIIATAALLLIVASPQIARAQSPATQPSAEQPPVGLEKGQTAPEIKGKDVKGKPMKLSDYRGKVVVLDFFGDW